MCENDFCLRRKQVIPLEDVRPTRTFAAVGYRLVKATVSIKFSQNSLLNHVSLNPEDLHSSSLVSNYTYFFTKYENVFGSTGTIQ